MKLSKIDKGIAICFNDKYCLKAYFSFLIIEEGNVTRLNNEQLRKTISFIEITEE